MPEPIHEQLDNFETPPPTFTPMTGTPVTVRIAVQVAGETKEFEAIATTTGDGFRTAGGLLGGLHGDATRWIAARES
jgi:hypothetical protein